VVASWHDVREIVHEQRQSRDPFGTARHNSPLPAAPEFSIRAELRAHLIAGQYVVDAFAFDPKRSKIVWSSPGLTLVGDQASYRRAHLGGKPENVTVQTAVADVVSRLDRQGRGEWQCCR
jgi:hypothetical protein